MNKEVSWSHLEMICQNDASCLEKFRVVIHKELPEEIKELRSALNKSSLDQAASHVHKIKHKFALMEMHTAFNYAKTYELVLREGNNNGQELFDTYLQELMDFLGL